MDTVELVPIKSTDPKLLELSTMKWRPLIALLAFEALLSACTGHPETVEPVTAFDVNRYQGVWYEIMRLDHSFERGLTNVTATYDIREDGTVGVLNRGFDREACRWREADGIATFQGAETVASLSVTFFWPLAGGYHVFAIDRQNYNHAMVAGPTTSYLWILARQPNLPDEIRKDLIARARARGFSVDDLIMVDHSEPGCMGARTRLSRIFKASTPESSSRARWDNCPAQFQSVICTGTRKLVQGAL